MQRRLDNMDGPVSLHFPTADAARDLFSSAALVTYQMTGINRARGQREVITDWRGT